MLGVLAAACLASDARATQIDLVRWFSAAAAPALQVAAPANDPALASRELLNRSLAGAFAQAQQVGPAWLTRVRLDLSFDPAFQPRYALAATQPLLTSARHAAAIDLHGRVAHDASGRTGGDLGLRYRGRWRHRDVSLGVQGGVDDRWREELQRFSLGAEFHLSSLELHAQLYDDVPARSANREIAERRLDGYDIGVGVALPYLSWARLHASRSWQIAVNGETVTADDRVSLRLSPLSGVEIETGTGSQTADRSWFTQLRWRLQLGE
jgi:hypothetical protein